MRMTVPVRVENGTAILSGAAPGAGTAVTLEHLITDAGAAAGETVRVTIETIDREAEMEEWRAIQRSMPYKFQRLCRWISARVKSTCNRR